MRVTFTVSISSGTWGSHGPGDSAEIPDEEAERLIAAGYATAAGKGPQGRETRVETPENTTARISRAGRKGKR